MKKDIHPEYRPVVFLDLTSGEKFVINSTATSRETTTLEDGTQAPLIKLDVTSASHPFYTGKQTILDTAGRVEKFKQRQAVGDKAKRAANRKAK